MSSSSPPAESVRVDLPVAKLYFATVVIVAIVMAIWATWAIALLVPVVGWGLWMVVRVLARMLQDVKEQQKK